LTRRDILFAVAVIGGIALFVLVSAISTLLIDRWLRRRHRMTLLERSRPYQPTSVADEAQRWLAERQS
jgi:peptidoglycan/LPS O-acetylase OafA/YrhL